MKVPDFGPYKDHPEKAPYGTVVVIGILLLFAVVTGSVAIVYNLVKTENIEVNIQ